MGIIKESAIWMDWYNAHLLRYTRHSIKTEHIHSRFSHQQKASRQENIRQALPDRQEQGQLDYYKALASIIRKYDEVVLFGPAGAELELLEITKGDYHFTKLKIESGPAGDLTTDERHWTLQRLPDSNRQTISIPYSIGKTTWVTSM